MNINKVLLQPAYVLHARSYRDTSLLLEIFTLEHGKISAIAKGARSARSRFRGILQPFISLMVSWYGKTELMSLSTAEPEGLPVLLAGQNLLCGFYLNELLVRLLHRYDPHPELFVAYQQALHNLACLQNPQEVLRIFEKSLLIELGYALQLDRETESNLAIEADGLYYFNPHGGLSRCSDVNITKANVFRGSSLLALHTNEFTEKVFLQDAKRLLRLALASLLGNKSIKSRELFL